ncbi:MAG TPA: nuclear transport factor 2 family protein [Burkholderiales bacterium]|nr:nuclear transport factor 2 family protein [Burkholderiales bacterium]
MADDEVLQELNRNYIRSAVQSDVRWYAENLADDFMASNPDGSLVDKAAFLARMSRPYAGKNPQAYDVRIRFVDGLALIHAAFRYTRPDGKAGTGRYTDIWTRREGRWLCASAHFNRT